MPRLLRIAPELPVSDLRAALDYFIGRLGFEHAATMPDGAYAIVERDDISIHLFEAAPDSLRPVSLHIFASGLEALHDELESRGARITQSIETKPWRARDFRVLDDSGNEIKFTEPLRTGG